MTTAMLELQSARIARARALSSESDAALARADEAKARMVLLQAVGGRPLHPRTMDNLLAEWEHNTVAARRLHDEAMGAFFKAQ